MTDTPSLLYLSLSFHKKKPDMAEPTPPNDAEQPLTTATSSSSSSSSSPSPAPSPSTTRTTTTTKTTSARVSHATDILLDPVRSAQRRYQAYVRARQRFWQAFPGGAFVRLPTPGTDLECGLHALRLSMQHQHQHEAAGPTDAAQRVAVPTLAELRAAFRSSAVAPGNAAAGLDNEAWFSADQLAAVFAEWGRRRGLRCQLGYVVAGEEGLPVMMSTPEVDTGEEGGPGTGIVRVWVWNDGWSLRGGVGHFEGIRRPSAEELGGVRGGVSEG